MDLDRQKDIENSIVFICPTRILKGSKIFNTMPLTDDKLESFTNINTKTEPLKIL